MPGSLRGLTIVLAGGSGGLGAVTARSLSAEGARLVVGYYSRAGRAAQLAPIASLVQADITRAEDRRKLLDAAPDLYGLVVFTGDPARVTDPAQAEAMLERSHALNYAGPILLAREAAARIGGDGAIVLISTMQAVALFPGSTIYAGAKAALAHAARILAKECRPRVRVNVIAPGIIAAGMAEASIASGKYNRYLQDGTLARFGRGEDVARAVRLLLEPDSYITGQVLAVDGGITL